MSEPVNNNKKQKSRFEKGKSGNPSGRPKGALNKTTRAIKEAIQYALDQNADQLAAWLKKAGKTSGAQGIFAYTALAEFVQPKLSRAEVTGKDGEDLNINFTETIISKTV